MLSIWAPGFGIGSAAFLFTARRKRLYLGVFRAVLSLAARIVWDPTQRFLLFLQIPCNSPLVRRVALGPKGSGDASDRGEDPSRFPATHGDWSSYASRRTVRAHNPSVFWEGFGEGPKRHKGNHLPSEAEEGWLGESALSHPPPSIDDSKLSF